MYFRCRGFYFCLPKTISFHRGHLIQVFPIRLSLGGEFPGLQLMTRFLEGLIIIA